MIGILRKREVEKMAMFLNIVIFVVGLIIGIVIMAVAFLAICSHFELAPLFLAVWMQAMYLLAVGIDALSRWVGAVF